MLRLGCLLTVFVLFFSPLSFAKGTNAGTVIANQAELRFSQGGVNGAVVRSNSVQFTVIEVIDVAIQSLDATAVATGSPDQSVPLTFRVSNVGNALGTFRLERLAPANAGDFVPTVAAVGSVFIENGLQPGFQATGPFADTRYVAGSNDLVLAADAAQIVYLVSDFPANLVNGNIGRSTLRAISTIPGAAGTRPGNSVVVQSTTTPNTAIVGASSAVAESDSSYLVAGTRVVMTKSQVAVRAPDGGSALVPGAECDYLIEVIVYGSTGQVDDFQLDDPLPLTLSYVANSLKINGVGKTDLQDNDEAHVVAQRITIKLGTLFPTARFTITYTSRLK